MAFASTRSSADSRFILGGLLLTLALAVLGSESACAAAQPSVSADYAANVPALGEAPSEERAAAALEAFCGRRSARLSSGSFGVSIWSCGFPASRSGCCYGDISRTRDAR